LKENWTEEILDIFDQYEKTPHKIDLWRYCMLYDTGGVYMDADSILKGPIAPILENSNCFFVSNNRGVRDIFNGFLGTFPKNPIYKEIIEFMVRTKNDFQGDYYFNCKELYEIVSRHVNIQIYQFNGYVFKEPVHIGKSDGNTKSVCLNHNAKALNPVIEWKNPHLVPDTFTGTFTHTNLLYVKRTDQSGGWGQDLECELRDDSIKVVFLWDNTGYQVWEKYHEWIDMDEGDEWRHFIYYHDQKILCTTNKYYPYPRL